MVGVTRISLDMKYNTMHLGEQWNTLYSGFVVVIWDHILFDKI